MDKAIERDCTTKCRSSVHARKILNSVPLASVSQLRSYSVWMCHNFASVTDILGRNILHVAASCGKWQIVDWLLKQCCAEVDIRDGESGWTALHRSFYYGQLASARTLYLSGASLKMIDHDGLSPLDIIIKDRLPYIEYQRSDPSDVYTWGSNFNYNLGIGNSQGRTSPEVLEMFRKKSIDIQKVEICKFHSVFLSKNGQVYTCGYGHGGRLGQGNEDMSLIPSLVKGFGTQVCEQIAAGQDHMLFLLENNQVWSCGLNLYHQLGLTPPPERLLAPKQLSLKFLKGKAVLGIQAARFHSVLYTNDGVFTFGLNGGQLGHPKGDRTQVQPRQVSTLNLEEFRVAHVAASDGATVCVNSRGDVYVLHEYQIRRIASRQLVLKVCVVGGHIDPRCDVAGVRAGGGLELRVAILTKFGKLHLWRETDPCLRRCIFNSPRQLTVSDVHINHHSLGIVTDDYGAFSGTVQPCKGRRPPTHPSPAPTRGVEGLVTLLDRDECHVIKVKKLSNVYRATSIACDSKGRNFAVLQSNPKMGLIEIPMLSESKMQEDFSRLLMETHKLDDFHDIIIKVGSREFVAHKFVLASRSEFFRKQLAKEGFASGVMSLDWAVPEAFEQALKYIYSNRCDLLSSGFEVKWDRTSARENGKKNKTSKAKPFDPVQILQELSKKLNLTQLTKKLERVKLVKGFIQVTDTKRLPGLSFNRLSMSELCDVRVVSSSGDAFPCHKCVLAARSDYFHSMLSTCWVKNDQLGNLTLPIPTKTVKVLLDYFYSDEAVGLSDSDDVEFLCNVLMTADQLLAHRLKEMSEVALVRLISLKNAAELLEFSAIYNSEQLKKTCMQFICINLAAIIELKCLDVLSDEVMVELSNYYRNLVPQMRRRRITGNSAELVEDVHLLEQQFPVSDTSFFERHRSDPADGKGKGGRRRISSLRASEGAKVAPQAGIVLEMSTPPAPREKPAPPSVSKSDPVPTPAPPKTVGPRVLTCPPKALLLSLESSLCLLSKKSRCSPRDGPKPFFRVAKKQWKAMGPSDDLPVPASSPPNPCPWAKLPQASPPSPSFWDAVAKRDSQGSDVFREPLSPVVPSSPRDVRTAKPTDVASPQEKGPGDVVISLHEIQIAEEQKLRRTANLKIKPLHILNIEDEAIEELLTLYDARDNAKERITISRVRPDHLASPVWRKNKGC